MNLRLARRCAAVLAAAAALLVPRAHAAGEIPPAPTRWVTDHAGFLSPPALEEIDGRLRSFEEQTGRQFLVFIDKSTGDVPIEDFAVRAFQKWGVGRSGKDDGVVLFIMADDRKARFEVGYGLEPVFPDILASRVIREVLAPALQRGDRDGAIRQSVDAAIGVISREASAPTPGRGRPGQGRPLTTGEKIMLGIGAAIFLFILITNPSLVFFLLQVITSSGSSRGGGGWSGGGGWGGGGGWSGGGGRSGGGGASGSW